MNYFTATGRLTKDFETASTGKVSWSTIAIDRRRKDQNGQAVTDFIPVRVLGERAVETAAKWLHKGSKIIIEGELQSSTYQNKEGKNVTQYYVIINNWEFAESKAAASKPVQEVSDAVDSGFIQIPEGIDEELPFN